MNEETAIHPHPALGEAPTITGYRLEHRLGQGGMGSVYAAEELALGRRVAIKVIGGSVAQSPDTLARFEREARTLATIEHANIVRVYAFGRTGTIPYLVMEHIAGETLADRIARGGPLGPGEALRITREVAGALDAAWERQIVHRDIKPSNILLDSRGGAHVADFGLAKLLTGGSTDAITESGLMVGTAHYISPEQAEGRELDFRSDIYSLGIVLFEMLAGQKPFHAATPIGIIARHLREPLPPLPAAMRREDPAIAELLLSMTAKSAGDRPASYRALLDRLDLIEMGSRAGMFTRGGRPLQLALVAAGGVALVITLSLLSTRPAPPEPQVVKRASPPSKPTYSGQPITFALEDAEIRNVMESFAEIAGVNVVVDSDVGGTTSVEFVDVPWDQALSVLCQQNGLTWVVQGKVIRIARLDTLVAEKEKERRLRQLTQNAR